MALFMAFQSPEIEVVGITTTFGNGTTAATTANALRLCELAGRTDVPVAAGDAGPIAGLPFIVAEFVHGRDALGGAGLPPPVGVPIREHAVDFLVDTVLADPKGVTILSLGPLTNIAQAIGRSAEFAASVAEIWVLGGSFFASGNVNAAGEANVLADPEAADVVFTSGANVTIVGLNVTTEAILTEQDLCDIRSSKGRFSEHVFSMSRCYRDWHLKSDYLDGIYLHDPAAVAGLLHPSLFTYKTGAVRVETQGSLRGHSLMDLNLKHWNGPNPWVGVPPCRVAMGIDATGTVAVVKALLSKA